MVQNINFLTFEIDLHNRDENIYKFAIISNIALFCIITFFGIMNMIQFNNSTLAIIELSFSSINLFSLLYFKKYRNIEFFLLTTTILLFIISLAFYLNSAKVLFSSLWLFFFPFVVFMLNGIKIGLYSSIIYALIIIIDSYLGIGNFTDLGGFLNISLGLVLFTYLAYLFEKEKEKSFKTIKDQQKQLSTSLEKNKTLLADNQEFVTTTIHQLRTPLSIIMLNADLLKMQTKDTNSIECINSINASISMLNNHYEDLSYLIGDKSLDYPVANILLDKFLKNRITFHSTIANINTKPIYISTKDEEYQYTISHIELERLIDNNISNALRYGAKNKPIEILLYKKDNITTLEFKTYGDAIKESKKIFQKCYRENTVEKGTGIGLFIVKEICDKYNILYDISYENNQNIFTYIFSTTN
ncbi:MAG: HAMP domain-containing histidine kinase [Campylobacteraceae bacterium]|nr:HAMP domain-containing histidine kinase [Campylobacteraceae bacterium]